MTCEVIDKGSFPVSAARTKAKMMLHGDIYCSSHCKSSGIINIEIIYRVNDVLLMLGFWNEHIICDQI